jgi:hypothetical protein
MASGALAVLGISVIPNESAATLLLDSSSQEDYDFQATQFGAAFTVSDEFPLYMEGFLGASRYDPKFVFSDGLVESAVRAKWTSVIGTAGLGWDFPLTDDLVLRPIANFSLGTVVSDGTLLQAFINSKLDSEVRFIDDGHLYAFGYGGSMMLDYQNYNDAREIDVELRYSHIHLQSFGDTSEAAKGEANAVTLGGWSRVRVPTGYTVFGRPLRGVGELAGSLLLGDQADALQSDFLVQVGAGIEFDTTDISYVPFYRVRLMWRGIRGQRLYGTSIGIGITF